MKPETEKLVLYALECLSQGVDLNGDEIGRKEMMQLCGEVLADAEELEEKE